MENMKFYEMGRSVPPEAMKKITGGRLNGMTDINPMWRIKKLTEMFGPCGIGWYPQIVRSWTDAGANGEIVVNMEILLYVIDNEGEGWSKGIPGIGGSKLVAKESGGLFTDDEAYKKAYTDAISVACKALGIGADVYFGKDSTKYDTRSQTKDDTPMPETKPSKGKKGITKSDIKAYGEPKPESVENFLKSSYGVDDLTELNEQETADVIDWLKSRKQKREEKK